MPRCSRNISAICQPTGKVGFSELKASWKIIEISGPRILRRLILGHRQQVVAAVLDGTLLGILAGGMSRMPMIACAVTDLPEPDSPRIARHSPCWTGS
jgi:hypothetical protein